VRVVGGTARGRPLVAPPGRQTRPTTDRVREAVFNALWSRGAVEDARVLDLFAGSGALGIEALSRGAAHATFVDADRAARAAVRRNLEVCGFADRADVVTEQARRFLERSVERGDADAFDLVFADPPYAYDDEDWGRLLGALGDRKAFVVAETGAPIDLPPAWEAVRASRYGSTWVTFLERAAT
jgi:16S rRNA (guanine966-N2)-methyltransferase